ncbi:MAG TPA: flagellar protein FlaG [Bacteroidota bacterium]|nr:flagellar protein FlaG [Bacteroidota bacterium]
MIATQPVGASSGTLPIDIYGAGQQDGSEGQQKASLSNAEVISAVKELNAAMKVVDTNLSFSFDSITKQTVVTVTDAQTNEVIRQIPPEEMLKVSQRIAELLGVLFDHAG